jgi:hypothetical protein
MRSTLRQIDDPHDAPIAPDIVPAEWAELQPAQPANDAASREKLFAEISQAAQTAAPKVDNSFRASDVNDIPARKKKSSRAWVKSAATAFVFALVSAVAAAAWKHHGDAATETLASWVPLPSAISSPAAEANAQPVEQAAAAQPAAEAPVSAATPALPPEAEQQIQSMTRDLAAMGQQIEQLKATIETLKANQQAAAAPPPAPPVARAHTPAPKPKASAAPKPPAPPPVTHSSRATYPPAMQAAAVPPPAAAPPPAYPRSYPAQTYPPPQATVQPNGEPVVRPPMPMPLSDRY